jgi:hypothetical protein
VLLHGFDGCKDDLHVRAIGNGFAMRCVFTLARMCMVCWQAAQMEKAPEGAFSILHVNWPHGLRVV